MDGLRRMIEVQQGLGALGPNVDLDRIVDTQFLPEDIRRPR
jgi:hypothetical protein